MLVLVLPVVNELETSKSPLKTILASFGGVEILRLFALTSRIKLAPELTVRLLTTLPCPIGALIVAVSL